MEAPIEASNVSDLLDLQSLAKQLQEPFERRLSVEDTRKVAVYDVVRKLEHDLTRPVLLGERSFTNERGVAALCILGHLGGAAAGLPAPPADGKPTQQTKKIYQRVQRDASKFRSDVRTKEKAAARDHAKQKDLDDFIASRFDFSPLVALVSERPPAANRQPGGGKCAVAAAPDDEPPLPPVAAADHALNVSMCTAVAMGTHPRLGMSSQLFRLPRDLVHKIAECAGVSVVTWYARPPPREVVELRRAHRHTFLELQHARDEVDARDVLIADLQLELERSSRREEYASRVAQEARGCGERVRQQEQERFNVRAPSLDCCATALRSCSAAALLLLSCFPPPPLV